MTLDTLIIFSGAFVAALPFLGFPTSWDTVLLLLAGIFIISLGIALRRRGHRGQAEKKSTEVFMENSVRGDHDTN